MVTGWTVKRAVVLAALFGISVAHNIPGTQQQHMRSFGRRQGRFGGDKDDDDHNPFFDPGKGLTSGLPAVVAPPRPTPSETTSTTSTTKDDDTTTSSRTTSSTETETTTSSRTTSSTETETTTSSKPEDPLSSFLSSLIHPTTTTTTTDSDSETSTTKSTESITNPLPTSTSSTETTSSKTDSPTDTGTGSPTDTGTGSPTDTATGTTTDTTTSSPTLSLPITISIPTLSLPISISDPISITDTHTNTISNPITVTDTNTDTSTTTTTTTDKDGPTGPTTTITTSPPTDTVTISDPPTPPITISDTTTTANTTSTITFPKGTDTTVTDTSTSVATTTVYSITLASDFTFFTASTLALASTPTTTSVTLTDPDAATVAPSAATTLNVAALPSDIPGKIYPPSTLDSNDLADMTLVSLLFKKTLNWKYVVDNDQASTQIFALLPSIINGALGLTSADQQTKTLYLAAFADSDYSGPADADDLATMYLGYVPSPSVNDLAAQIKVETSAFYSGMNDPLAKALAQQIIPSFDVRSVADPNSATSGSSTSGNAATSGSKTRQDAIIGVVSALGGIALLVLLFLLYRSYKRRQQLANRRLSDPPNDYIGERTPGRDFDQDSIGGQRRRSFYFAEDSLRGAGPQQGESSGWVSFGNDGSARSGGAATEEEYYDYSRNQAQMSQRRPVVGGDISAPILRGSTMNW